MNRFVKWFCAFRPSSLVEMINKYATGNKLKIISVSANADLHEAIVLFER